MEVVKVLNRTSQVVNGVWDGKPYKIAPHTIEALPIVIAEAIKRQNVVMGSEDPYTGEMQYLVAIMEHGDDESPIEQSRSITKMNRSNFQTQEQVVKGIGGMYSVKDRVEAVPLPLSTTFAKP